MGRPFAYLRKSAVRDLSTSFGPETQEREVRGLAERFGDNGERLVIKADWDISGAGQYTRKRTGYLELVAAIESGEASAVYSYSLSRLGRAVHELSRLFDLCRDQRVPIRLVADSIDTSTASGTMVANILASVAQFESQVASERRLAQNATKAARGLSLRTRRCYGEAEGEDAERVLALWRETGSYTATARRLNAGGVPARSGKQWWAASVKLVVRRLDPTIRSEGKGRKARVSFRLARLLRCPYCGTLLTGTTARGRARYACSNYTAAPHPRTSISERVILPAIQAEAARLRAPVDRVTLTADAAEQDRIRLLAEREAILRQHRRGYIDDAELDRQIAEVDASLARLEAAASPVDVPEAIEWDRPPALVNEALRALWEYVQLGPDFQPVRAEWRLPEWRAGVVTQSL